MPSEVVDQTVHEASEESVDNESKSELEQQLMDLFNEMVEEIAIPSSNSVNLEFGESIMPAWSSTQAQSITV